MKSVLVIGLGRFGRHLSRKFIEEGNAVLAIEKDETRADWAVNIVNEIQIGDATNEDFIKSLGVNNFDICVVAVGDNFQTALEITVLLKDFGAEYIIARASRDVHRKLLLRNGADHVVYAEREIAEKIAIKYGAKNVFDYLELTPNFLAKLVLYLSLSRSSLLIFELSGVSTYKAVKIALFSCATAAAILITSGLEVDEERHSRICSC